MIEITKSKHTIKLRDMSQEYKDLWCKICRYTEVPDIDLDDSICILRRYKEMYLLHSCSEIQKNVDILFKIIIEKRGHPEPNYGD